MAIEDDSARRNRNNSWWKQRTKMERRLILVIMVAIVLIIGLSIGTAIAANSGRRSPCLSETCVKEAAHLLNRMNTSINPCDDFYEFACGRYVKTTEIPGDKTDIDPLVETGDLINSQVRQLISEPTLPGEVRPFVMLKKLYNACMNTTAIEEKALAPIKTLLKRLGGWPILEQSNWVEANWVQITQRLRLNGFETSHFITVDSDINPKNSSEYIVSVDQAKNEEVGDENLRDGLQDELVLLYANYMIDLAVLLGANREFATKEVHDVIDFRSKISGISVARREHLLFILAANESTVGQLQQNYPSIDWLNLINSALAVPNRTITSKDKVVLVVPEYVAKFEDIINKTPKRVQVNHALLQVIRSLINFLPRVLRDREQAFMGEATGTTAALPRWNICVRKTSESFKVAADALYVRRYVEESTKMDVTEMVSHIKSVFVNMLKDVEWMDSKTKKLAIDKAESITTYIAYATELRDDKNLEKYYEKVQFQSDDILQLVSEISKFKRDMTTQFYGTPVVKNHWTTHIAVITNNAVYDPQGNSIQIPSGIMQNEFYNRDRPRYMNYGGLGLVVGHELTHGFDNTGKAFDKYGNTANWWEEATNDAYATKAQCFIDQYTRFVVPEVNISVNGLNTLGENIADNGGIKVSYLAFLEWNKRNKEELPLPGINYSPKQLFWISLANAWCSKSRQSALEQTLIGDEHSPDRYRILGGVSNMHYFSEDFNCPTGSRMNPQQKCKIW